MYRNYSVLRTSLPNITRPCPHVNSIYKVDFVKNAQDELFYKVGFIICPFSSITLSLRTGEGEGEGATLAVIPACRRREFVSEVIPSEFDSEFPANAPIAGRNQEFACGFRFVT